MARGVEFLAQRASELAPALGTKDEWLRQAYEAVKLRVPAGVDPEPLMAEVLHDRCSVLKSRADGLESLQAGVRRFRSNPLVPVEVLAVNRRRLQEAGGLTDALKRELGQETYAEQRQRQVQIIEDKSSAQKERDTHG